MTRLLPVALIVLAAASARADLGDQLAAQREAARGQTAQLKQMRQAPPPSGPLIVGKKGPDSFAKGVMENSASWLKQTPQIARFINENGCAVKDGKYATVKMTCPAPADGAPACVDFGKIVDDVAKNTEVVYIDMATMQALTNNAHTLAFGITKELKKVIRVPTKPGPPDPSDTGRAVALGAPGKNTIALRGEPVAAGEKAPDSGTFSVVLAHEFLHIALRQVDNAALGGGARKSEHDPDIANMHHRLTDGLGWKAFGGNQSDKPWTPAEGPDPGCAKAGQAAP